MFLPCCVTTFPLHQRPPSQLSRYIKTCGHLISTIRQSQVKMNRPVIRGTMAVVGAGALAYWVYQGNAMPTKNQKVIWGISGQLNDMNADAEREEKVERRLEKIYGSVFSSLDFHCLDFVPWTTKVGEVVWLGCERRSSGPKLGATIKLLISSTMFHVQFIKHKD